MRRLVLATITGDTATPRDDLGARAAAQPVRARPTPVRMVTHGDSRSLKSQSVVRLSLCSRRSCGCGHLLCTQGVTVDNTAANVADDGRSSATDAEAQPR